MRFTKSTHLTIGAQLYLLFGVTAVGGGGGEIIRRGAPPPRPIPLGYGPGYPSSPLGGWISINSTPYDNFISQVSMIFEDVWQLNPKQKQGFSQFEVHVLYNLYHWLHISLKFDLWTNAFNFLSVLRTFLSVFSICHVIMAAPLQITYKTKFSFTVFSLYEAILFFE